MPPLPSSRPSSSAWSARSTGPGRRTRSPLRRLATGLGGTALACGVALAPSAPASGADEYTNSVAAFGSADTVYVSPDASVSVDEATLESDVAGTSAPVLVAVVPASAGGATDLSLQLVRDFPEHTVAVISGNRFAASSDAVCPGVSAQLASDAAVEYGEQLGDGGDVTAMVTHFVQQIGQAPTANCADVQADGQPADESSSIWLWLVGIGLAGLLASGVAVRQLRRRKARQLADRRVELDQLRGDLEARMRGLDPATDDPGVAPALADATERRAAGIAVLASAETDDEYDAARRALLEAMTAVRFARAGMGVDPGPPVPAPAESFGPHLVDERDVRYADEVYRGFPDYRPGAPHYFGGDGTVPGGWYAVPFWESASIGTVLAHSDAGEGREDR